jgi:hypothetical protein
MKVLGLRAGDLFRRQWRNALGADVIWSEAWGGENERSDGSRSGYRLRVRSDSLMAFLRIKRKRLVLLAKVQKYLKDETEASRRRGKRRKRFMPFRTQTLIVIVCPLEGVRVIQRIPKAVREAVERIPEQERHVFGSRLQAIARTIKPSRK